MRKPDFCICGNKGGDQLCGNRTADQRICFHYLDSKVPLLHKSEIFSLLPSSVVYIAQFVSDLVGNPKDRFYHNAVQIIMLILLYCTISTDTFLSMESEKRISPRARKLERTLARKLTEFLSSDVLYTLRRVLAAEMKHVYVGPDKIGMLSYIYICCL